MTFGPVPESVYGITFNTKTHSLIILTWENETAVIWEWKENNWKKQTTEKIFPGYRSKYALAYNRAHDAIFLFGGRDKERNPLNDLWKYHESKWEKIESLETPGKRAGHSLLSIKDQLFLYGGTLAGGKLSNELWLWNGTWSQIK